jgi:ferredoxin-NADP reductase
MKVRFERRSELAPTIWEYHFAPEQPLDFIPGQYTDFHFLQPLGDPRGQSRTFSFTSLPGDTTVSFVVKFPVPCSPYKQALQLLQSGDELRVDDAMGDLVLPKLPTIPLVFIAGGIGLASFASMLRQLLQEREEREIYLFYAVRSRSEQIFRDITTAYPLTLRTIAIKPHRLTAQEIVSSTPPSSYFYLSGSQGFVEGLHGGLMQLGVPHEQVIFDYFDGYVEL